MPKSIQFHVFYSREDAEILASIAAESNFRRLNKFIYFRLCREAKRLKALPPESAMPQKRKRVCLRIKDASLIEKLDAYSRYFNIPITVLIKRLVTDPLILQRYLEGVAASSHPPEPESP